MIKALFSIMLAFTFSVSFAGNAELFQVDEQEINAEFAQLNELEAFVEANEGITFQEVSIKKDMLLKNVVNTSNPTNLNITEGEPPLGIPSFLWGFCPTFVPLAGCVLGAGGVLLVYFVADDRDETKKALIGYGVAILINVAFVVVYTLVLENAYFFF